jgi:hypothetical protein
MSESAGRVLVCAYCGKSTGDVRFHKSFMECYCKDCMIKLAPVARAELYQKVEKTGRRIYGTLSGSILRVEDY